MKIGILGGTFNPIHNSHLYLAKEYHKSLGLDKVYVIPTFFPPHKEAKNLASATDRLAMCRLAAENIPFLEVCDYEIKKADISYTYQTLEYLQKSHPKASFYLLMGADIFLTFLQWKNPERVTDIAILCTVPREKGELIALLEQKEQLADHGMRSIVLEIEAKPLSSTRIRELVQKQQSVEEYLPPKVWSYIKEKKLYQ